MNKKNEIHYLQEGNLIEASKLILETASWIRKREEADDNEFKIHLYIIEKYKDKLIEDLGLKPLSRDGFFEENKGKTSNFNDFAYQSYVLHLIRDAIIEEMNKKMPEPWYAYGFNTSKEE